MENVDITMKEFCEMMGLSEDDKRYFHKFTSKKKRFKEGDKITLKDMIEWYTIYRGYDREVHG